MFLKHINNYINIANNVKYSHNKVNSLLQVNAILTELSINENHNQTAHETETDSRISTQRHKHNAHL